MENNPIDTMLEEHNIITRTERIIEKLDHVWESDADKYQDLVGKLIIFFRDFADGFHHQKEEQVLFPAIKNHPDFILDELLDEFEQHHEDFREYSVEIQTSLAEEDYTETQKVLSTYIEELMGHISAENDELFIMAENLLDHDSLEEIYFKFKDIDLELGEDNKKNLENLLTSIEESL